MKTTSTGPNQTFGMQNDRFTFLLPISFLLYCLLFATGCKSNSIANVADPTPHSQNFAIGDSSAKSLDNTAELDLEATNEEIVAFDDILADDFSDDGAILIEDPFEDLNRAVFQFNDGFYLYVLDPLASGYTWIVPDPVEVGITNFFDNLNYPVRLVAYSLQGQFDLAGLETVRFLIDSTVGIGGFLRPSDDIAALADLPGTDLGLTFAFWGIDHGPYLILPFLGPSSVRDTVGFLGERFLDPINYLEDEGLEISLNALEVLNRSPEILENYSRASDIALDPYTSLKDFYIQLRDRQLQDLRSAGGD